MKKFELLLILLVIVSCRVNNSQEKKKIEFSNYLKSLDKISLPMSNMSIGEFQPLSKNYDSLGFTKYKHVWTSMPMGKLFETDSFISLVEFSIGDEGLVPFITNFNKNGEKLDSLGPFKKSGSDIGYDAVEYLSINNDRSIMVIDTVKKWKLNEDKSDIIAESLTVTIDTTIYWISNDGKFIEK